MTQQVVTVKLIGDNKVLIKSVQEAVKNYQKLDKQLEASKKKLEGATPNKAELDKTFGGLKKLAKEANVPVDELVDGFVGLQKRGLDPTVEDIRTLTKEADKFGRTFQQQLKVVDDVEAGMKKLGVASAAAATAIGGIFLKGTNEFVELDRALRQSGVVSGATTEELTVLREEVERLGIETSKAPKDIAQTSIALSRAGFSAAETSTALDGIVKASEATGESLAVVGDITAKAIRAFGLAASESNTIANLLTTTASTTNTTVAGIGQSLSFVSATAASANQPIEDVLVAIGLLGDAGIETTSAGTNLAAALERLKVASAAGSSEFGTLSKGSATAGKALAAIGADVRNANGELKPLTEIIPLVRDNITDLSKADKDILFKALFGVEGGRAFQTLLNATPERVSEVTAAINDSAGSANVASKALLEGLGGAFDLLGGSASTALTKFGEFAANGLEPVVRSANAVLVAFNELPAPIQNVLIATTGLTGVITAAIAVTTAYNALNVAQVKAQTLAAAAALKRTAVEKGKTAALLAGNAATTFQTAITAKMTVSEVAAAASKTATTAATKAKTAALGLATAATGKQAAANLAIAKSGAVLLAQLGLVVAAVASLKLAYDSVAEAGTEFNENSKNVREALRGIAEESDEAGESLSREIEPDRGIFGIFGASAEKRINDTRINVREFREDLGNLSNTLLKLGDSQEDVTKGQELYGVGIKDIDDAISKLNEEELGTEVYEELRAELVVSRKELTKVAEAKGFVGASAEEVAIAQEKERESTEAQTEALKAQAEALRERTEAEELQANRNFEDQSGDRADAEAKARLEAERQADEERIARKREFDKTVQDAQLEFDRQRDQINQKREAEDFARKKAQEEELEAIRDKAEAERQKINADAEARGDRLQENRDEQRRTAEENFADNARDEEEQFQADIAALKRDLDGDRQDEQRAFEQEIEALKNEQAEARRESERALAEEISERNQAQSEAFTEAGRILSEQEKLAAAESEAERAQIRAQFDDERRRAEEVAALVLADKVLSPDELVKAAQDIANVTTPTNAEEARRLQETLSAIEAEQKAQQAEADKQAQLELEAELAAIQKETEAEIEAQKLAFTESQQTKKLADEQEIQSLEAEFADAQRDRQKEFNEQQRQLDRENQLEIERIRAQAEQQVEAVDAGEESSIDAVNDRIAEEDRERTLVRAEEDRQFKLQTEEQINAAKQQFEDAERTNKQQFQDAQNAKQAAFEDAEREKKRAFDDERRAKDLETAQQIEAIEQRIDALKETGASAAPTPEITDIEARFKGGPVVPEQVYRVGEIRPEVARFDNGKEVVVGQGGPELVRFKQRGYVFPNMVEYYKKSQRAIAKQQVAKLARMPKQSQSLPNMASLPTKKLQFGVPNLRGNSIQNIQQVYPQPGVPMVLPTMPTIVNNTDLDPLLNEMRIMNSQLKNQRTPQGAKTYIMNGVKDMARTAVDIERGNLRATLRRGKL